MKLLFKTPIPQSFQDVSARFNQELFTFLSPPLIPFHLLRFDGCKKGDEIHLELGIKGITGKWVSLVTAEETHEGGWSFTDEGKVLPWPLSYWKHQHRVDKISDTESVIVDDIQYGCSPAVMAPVIAPILWSIFAVRPYRYKKFFKV